jgi:hypothetical protein
MRGRAMLVEREEQVGRANKRERKGKRRRKRSRMMARG